MKKQALPLMLALAAFAVVTSPAFAASDSDSALRFFGTGAGQTDRVIIAIDDNTAGADASTPADIGAGSFTIEFCVRGHLADNPAAPAVAFDSSVGSNVWRNGNIVLDRDIWSDGTGNVADHFRDYGISFAQGRVMFGTGPNDNAGERGPDTIVDGENTIIGSIDVLDGQWHHVACIRDVVTGTKTICVDGIVDFSAAAVSDDDISFPDGGVTINPSSTGANETLVVGAEKHDAGGAFPSFNGYVDELRLWKAALPKDCLNRYDNRVLINPTAGRGPADGFPDLVGSYRFEEGAGASTADASGATHANGNTNNAGTVATGMAGAAEWALQSIDANNVCAVYNGTDFGGPLTGTIVTSGLTRPLFVCSPPGDNDRLFIVEQRAGTTNDTGRIRIYKKGTNTLLPTSFLEITGLSTPNEAGLLSLAFHPNYASNGFFYVNFNVGDPIAGSEPLANEINSTMETVIRRYTVSANSDIADAGSAVDILRIPQPFGNHNGGWMGFNPFATGDARFYLHISTGDGGAGNDRFDAGQAIVDTVSTTRTKEQFLGKILRLDVGSAGTADDFPPALNGQDYAIPATNRFAGATIGADEIWHYGIRNPWRASFDRSTGDFWLADVGQNNREEIDFRSFTTSDAADGNYGWRLREGFIQTPTGGAGVGGPKPADNVDPILDYEQDDLVGFVAREVINGQLFGRSITGGYVYRGPLKALEGTYFFGDARSDKLWSMRYHGGVITELTERTAELIPGGVGNPEITSFGEDNEGNLYYCSRNGNIVQITQNEFYIWRDGAFTLDELTDNAISGVDDDGDGDTKTTIEEFLVDSDPNVNDGPLDFSTTTEDDGGDDYLTLTLTRDPQAEGVVKVTGTSGDDPAALTPVPAPQVLIDTPTMFKFRDGVPMSTEDFRFGQFKFELE